MVGLKDTLQNATYLHHIFDNEEKIGVE